MLDKRLLACAELVRPGVKMCDVGTDHGYLPCYLVKNQMVCSAIAADVNEKPLKSAEKTVREYELCGKVSLKLSDGLREISADEADDVVIAGMGGELIARLVLECDWVKHPEKHLILQPMTNLPYLRKTLSGEGFSLEREVPVYENGHHYSVMLWVYRGERKELDELTALAGRIPELGTAEGKAYLNYQRERVLKIAEGLEKSRDKQEEAEHYFELARKISQWL